MSDTDLKSPTTPFTPGVTTTAVGGGGGGGAEVDPEATAAVERAQQFFEATTPPPYLAAAEKQFRDWVTLQQQKYPNRRVVCITSGGTTVPLEKNTVRFIDNFSTGGRGAACTEAFLDISSSGGDTKQSAADGEYAVLLIRRTGSICPYARHVTRYLASHGGGGFDLALMNAISSIDGSNGQLTLKPPASNSGTAAAAAAAKSLKAKIDHYQSVTAQSMSHRTSHQRSLHAPALIACAPLPLPLSLSLPCTVQIVFCRSNLRRFPNIYSYFVLPRSLWHHSNIALCCFWLRRCRIFMYPNPHKPHIKYRAVADRLILHSRKCPNYSNC